MKKYILACVAFLLFSGTVFAADPPVIRDYLVDIEIQNDGRVDVMEKILYDFGEEDRHGIFRDIPTEYGDAGVQIDINVTGVTDENGEPYLYQEYNYDYYKDIKIGSPDYTITGQNWYYISYSTENVLNLFDEYDELYWNVTGNYWDVPIDHVQANVKVPSGGTVSGKKATCYSGYFGEAGDNCSAEVVGPNEFHFESSDSMAYEEGLTLVAGFEKDLVKFPVIRKYYADIMVNEDSSVDVSNEILYDFRDSVKDELRIVLPDYIWFGEYDYETYPLKIEVFDVRDEEGNSYDFFVEDYYDYEIVVDPGEQGFTGTNWFYVDYKIYDYVYSMDSYDEMYLDVTGNFWSVLIEDFEARVVLPSGGTIAGKSGSCLTSNYTCSTEILSDNVIHFSDKNIRARGSGAQIYVDFEKGLVDLPATLILNVIPYGALVSIDGEMGKYSDRFKLSAGEHTVLVSYDGYKDYQFEVVLESGEIEEIGVELGKTFWTKFWEKYLAFILFAIGSLIIVWIWYRGGRDEAGKGTIMPLYTPPGDIEPGVMGVLYDEKAHLHDITASLVNLAVKGFIKIKQEKKKKKFWWGEETSYKFIKLKNIKVKDNVPEYEKLIFNGIFTGSTKEKTLKQLERQFYKHLPKIKKELYKAVTDAGMFAKNPDTVRSTYMGGGCILFAAMLGVGFLAIPFTLSGWYIFILPFLGLELVIFSYFMPKRTKVGRETYEQVLGYKEFLETAEKDRIKTLFSPKDYKGIFEKYLPYAMVFEVEERWAKQFKDLYKGEPDWYSGAGTFNLVNFSRAMNTMSSTAAKAMTVAPRSSGSGSTWKSGGWGGGFSGGSSSWSGGSGFSSGGFSGGGFGGGGGGSW